jgi:hypothetical protein
MTDVMRRTVLKSLILVAVLASQASFAQEQSEADANDTRAQTETEEADTKNAPTERSAQQQKDKDRDREIFRPSEEISEDFAVSFPVDI